MFKMLLISVFIFQERKLQKRVKDELKNLTTGFVLTNLVSVIPK